MYDIEIMIALLLGVPIGLCLGWIIKKCLIRLGIIEKDE